MTPEKVLSIVTAYEARLVRCQIAPITLDPTHPFSTLSRAEQLGHVHRVILDIKQDVAAGRLTNAYIALGYVQAIIITLDWYTTADINAQNRPLIT